MRAGRLRNRIRIENGTQGLDSYGDPTDVTTWAIDATVWGGVRYLTGKELEDAEQIQPEVSSEVTLRYKNLNAEQRLLIMKANTTLDGAISTTDGTALTVSESLNQSESTEFRILVGSEIMIVSSVSGLDYTVERGADGTTAATHLDDVDVWILAIFEIQSVIDIDERERTTICACIERP